MITGQTSLRDWLSEGPFTIALSSSFFGFFAHCGIMTVLEEFHFKPQKITGASAGALIGGGLASGISPLDLKKLLFSVGRKDFWDPRPGLGVLRGGKFLKILEKNFVPTFNKAHIPLEVAALDIFSMKTVFLKEGLLPLAVAASCAVPVMFHPVRIGTRLYSDGGIFNKAAIQSEKVDERILGIYLESAGAKGVYERTQLVKNLSPNHKVIHFGKLPRVNFYSLTGREQAFDEGYRRVRDVLTNSAASCSIQG